MSEIEKLYKFGRRLGIREEELSRRVKQKKLELIRKYPSLSKKRLEKKAVLSVIADLEKTYGSRRSKSELRVFVVLGFSGSFDYADYLRREVEKLVNEKGEEWCKANGYLSEEGIPLVWNRNHYLYGKPIPEHLWIERYVGLIRDGEMFVPAVIQSNSLLEMRVGYTYELRVIPREREYKGLLLFSASKVMEPREVENLLHEAISYLVDEEKELSEWKEGLIEVSEVALLDVNLEDLRIRFLDSSLEQPFIGFLNDRKCVHNFDEESNVGWIVGERVGETVVRIWGLIYE